MIYQAIYQKAVESGNFLFVFALIAALVTSVLTLASFVKVSQSVFFGQLSVEFENTEEAPDRHAHLQWGCLRLSALSPAFSRTSSPLSLPSPRRPPR